MKLPHPNELHVIHYCYLDGSKEAITAAPRAPVLPWYKRIFAKPCDHPLQQVYERIDRRPNYEFQGQGASNPACFVGIVCLGCGYVIKESRYE